MVTAGRCGWCSSDDTDAEFVNNGVGMEQVTAAVCNHCGAVQMGSETWINETDRAHALDPEDRKRGWYASEETRCTVDRDARALEMRARDYNNGETMLVEYEGTVHQAFKRVSWADATFQCLCGVETLTAQRPWVDAITCFGCIAYAAKGRP